MENMVDLLIPHYGERKFLDGCLGSVEDSLDKPTKILIFNNTGDNIEESESENRIVVHEIDHKNVGFTKAVNELILLSDADFYWILNNDAVVGSEALGSLLEVMKKYPDCGIVSSYIYDADLHDRICFTGGGEPVPGTHRTDKSKNPRSERWVTFCSVLIRAQMIREIGFLDPNYFLICSDSDLCYTARSRGWKVMSDPNSSVFHHEKHGISRIGGDNQDPSLRRRIMIDQCYFRDKWIGSELFRDLNLEVFPQET